jgi:hypothetical protein
MHAMRRQLAGYVRQAAPEAMMMVGGAYPHAEVLGHVDVWDPEIDVWPGKKLSVSQARQVVQECQGRGERFFWYVAAGPTAPHPNVQLEYPLVGARVFLWMSWKYRVTGLEYYCYNLWGYNTKGAKRWPEAPWDARAFVSRNSAYNCDGMLFYPGPKGTPCSSLRLENIRDGVEDWESLHLLRDYADALRNRAGAKPSAQAADLLRRADAMLDVPDEVVTSVSQWSQDGDLLLKTRKALGDLIVAVKAVVPQAEYEKVRDGRLSDQLDRQRKMLRQRVQEAATRAATQTAPAR